MKGATFIALNDMIEELFGLQAWEDLLCVVDPPSKGIYTSTEDYHDREMADFILAISKKFDLSIEDVQIRFGEYLFTKLNQMYPIFTKISTDYFQFLESINDVIHKEVKKLYNEPGLPNIGCRRIDDTTLEVSYQSPRKLCFLADGLIRGAAHHYNHKIDTNHTKCMHLGHPNCLIEVTILLEPGQGE